MKTTEINSHPQFLFRVLISLIAVPLFLTNACVPRMVEPVSVLAKGTSFRTDPQDKDVVLYRNPNIKITSYSKFLIDPVKVFSNESHSLTPKEASLLAENFRTELIESLKDGYPIVTEAGPGVLRVRTAIQDIQPAHVELDEDKFIVLRMDTLLSRVAMEIECVDSLSGERVAALIHTLYDQKYFEKKTAARLLNIREAFGIWTQSLRKRFDEAKARPDSGL